MDDSVDACMSVMATHTLLSLVLLLLLLLSFLLLLLLLYGHFNAIHCSHHSAHLLWGYHPYDGHYFVQWPSPQPPLLG